MIPMIIEILGVLLVSMLFISCLFIIISVWTFQFLCIIWSPFAGLICALIARKKGLNALRYALIGALYSALLFAPWRFLVQRMRNRRFSYEAVERDCVWWLYSLWVGTIVANAAMVAAVLRLLNTEWTEIYFFPIALIPVAVGMPTWILSIRASLHRRSNAIADTDKPPADILPERVFVMPFAYASANVMFIPCIFGAGWLLSPLF